MKLKNRLVRVIRGGSPNIFQICRFIITDPDPEMW